MATDREMLALIEQAIHDHLNPPAPPPANVINVNAGADLQAAYDQAPAGATLALEAGATFQSFRAQPKAGAHPNNRVTVTTRNWQGVAAGMAGLASVYAARGGMAKIRPIDGIGYGVDVPVAANRTGGFVDLVGVAIDPVGPAGAGAHVRIGSGISAVGSEMPGHVRVKQCYLRGDQGFGTKRGIEANGTDIEVEQSWVEECHRPAQDAQALGGNIGQRVTARFCYFAAGAENVLVGGDRIRGADTNAEDWLIEDCIVHKPLRWLMEFQTTGKRHQVKNLIEAKACKRFTCRRVLAVNNWVQAQDGRAILINYSTNGTSPLTAGLEDVLLEDIAVLNSPGGINLQGYAYQADSQNTNKLLRATCRHIYLSLGAGRPLTIGNVKGRHDVTIERCTFAHRATTFLTAYFGKAWEGAPPVLVPGGPIQGFAYRDNVVTRAGTYQITADPAATHFAQTIRQFVDQDLDISGNIIGGIPAGTLARLNALGVGSGNVIGDQAKLEAMFAGGAIAEAAPGKGADPFRLAPIMAWMALLPEP